LTLEDRSAMGIHDLTHRQPEGPRDARPRARRSLRRQERRDQPEDRRQEAGYNLTITAEEGAAELPSSDGSARAIYRVLGRSDAGVDYWDGE